MKQKSSSSDVKTIKTKIDRGDPWIFEIVEIAKSNIKSRFEWGIFVLSTKIFRDYSFFSPREKYHYSSISRWDKNRWSLHQICRVHHRKLKYSNEGLLAVLVESKSVWNRVDLRQQNPWKFPTKISCFSLFPKECIFLLKILTICGKCKSKLKTGNLLLMMRNSKNANRVRKIRFSPEKKSHLWNPH